MTKIMIKSFVIIITLSCLAFSLMHYIVAKEAVFWALVLFVSLSALTLILPNKDVTKIVNS